MRTIFEGKLLEKGEGFFILFDTNYGIKVKVYDNGDLVSKYNKNDSILVLAHSVENENYGLMVVKK